MRGGFKMISLVSEHLPCMAFWVPLQWAAAHLRYVQKVLEIWHTPFSCHCQICIPPLGSLVRKEVRHAFWSPWQMFCHVLYFCRFVLSGWQSGDILERSKRNSTSFHGLFPFPYLFSPHIPVTYPFRSSQISGVPPGLSLPVSTLLASSSFSYFLPILLPHARFPAVAPDIKTNQPWNKLRPPSSAELSELVAIHLGHIRSFTSSRSSCLVPS